MPTARQFGSMLMASGGSVEGPEAEWRVSAIYFAKLTSTLRLAGPGTIPSRFNHCAGRPRLPLQPFGRSRHGGCRKLAFQRLFPAICHGLSHIIAVPMFSLAGILSDRADRRLGHCCHKAWRALPRSAHVQERPQPATAPRQATLREWRNASPDWGRAW